MLRPAATKTGRAFALASGILTVLTIAGAGSFDAAASPKSMARLKACLRSCGQQASRCSAGGGNRTGDCDVREGACKAGCRQSVRD
jgi:hypothetical protein